MVGETREALASVRRSQNQRFAAIGVALAIALGQMAWFGPPAFAAVPAAEVIAHDDVAADFLTRQFLRSVFTLRVRVWPDGQPIHIFVLDDNDAVHAAFCLDVLGTYPYILRRTWSRMTFTGTGLVPVRVGSIEEMRRRVESTPGAVGYRPVSPPSIPSAEMDLQEAGT